MTTNEFEQRVYRVMVTVLGIPNASPKIVAERCDVSVDDLFGTLEYTDTEGLLANLRITHGGWKNTPQFVAYDRVQRTMKGNEFMKRFEKEGVPHISGGDRPTVFVSYNRDSGSDFADSLEEQLSACAKVIRDTDLDDWGSFTEFMKTIRKQDFAVIVITDKYLKSEACMFEVSEVMKDENWRDKAMFAVLDTGIYSKNQSDYIRYWQDQRLEAKRSAEGIDVENMGPITAKLKKIAAIEQCLGDFLMAVYDANNPKPYGIIQAVMNRIRFTTKQNYAEGLDNTPYAKEQEAQVKKALGLD